MFLEKLEIQGFKSFAGKNILKFPGNVGQNKKGITAVVGPNGSGKSNIADAIRWALGEQSMKTLRAKLNEDVIFSGSSNKGRLGMSEVSLHLNNENKQAPIDYSQLVITRRLYRSGDNEYLINNAKTKLSDIQMLLAKANFGQKTYSVIGQGMVEDFLKTGPAERKNFFDEATGVKQYQIKRERSLNKLISSQKNLKQAEMLLSEIEPRLKSLTKQVNKLRQKEELKDQIKELQNKYYRTKWHSLNNKFSQYKDQLLELEEKRRKKTEKLNRYNQELSDIEKEDRGEDKLKKNEQELEQLQQNKEEIVKQIAGLTAQLEANLESQGKFDVSWLYSREEEVSDQIKKSEQELDSIQPKIEELENKINEINSQKKRINDQINELNKELFNLIEPDDKREREEEVKEKLEEINNRIEKLKAVDDINKIKDLIVHIEGMMQEAINMTTRKKQEKNASITRKKKEMEKKIKEQESSREEAEGFLSHLNSEKNSLKQRQEFLNKNIQSLKKEHKEIKNKLSKHQQEENQEDILNKKQELQRRLESVDEQISSLKKKTNDINREREEQNRRIFSIQRKAQDLQKEINDINNRIGEIKSVSIKYETRLEELEEEIRQETNDIKTIKDDPPQEEIDIEGTKQRIDRIRNQLNLIGGIDPEVENEYERTKEKYDFLADQAKDLKQGINNLKNIIHDLDKTIKKKFDKEFRIISDKFEEYFKILFKGGSAKIIKVPQQEAKEGEEGEEKEEDEYIKKLYQYNSTGLAGIDIQATPPGKKIHSLSVLSGGEKALVSIALICAIINANPSPFVVLDEVDAALDEANSQKFAQILNELSHNTQFILITHNRASMHQANVLYGTTMDENGITKLLSLQLKEAEKRVK
jgi:chromosome segregation protein